MWFLVSNTMSRLLFLQILVMCIFSPDAHAYICYNIMGFWSSDIQPRTKGRSLAVCRMLERTQCHSFHYTEILLQVKCSTYCHRIS